MKTLERDQACIYVPDGMDETCALARTEVLCIAAHPDDVEFMAYSYIAAAHRENRRIFTSVVAADGAGGPAGLNGEQVAPFQRAKEQRHAADIGRYAAAVLLNYTSAEVRATENTCLHTDIIALCHVCNPKIVITHSLADRHDTHVALALHVIKALRQSDCVPHQFLGVEMWRSLDWLSAEDKVLLDTSDMELCDRLLGCYTSQLDAKRYDRALPGRWQANATFFDPYHLDDRDGIALAMNLMPLLQENQMKPAELVGYYMENFREDVIGRLQRLGCYE